MNFEAPYLIAEIGVNHENDLNIAYEMIEEAKNAGANAVKFQSYSAETLASRKSPAYWDMAKEATSTQFELFKKYDKFGVAEYKKLLKHCEKIGIEFCSTPFDEEYVDFIGQNAPFFKIASADINNYPLLKQIAVYNKPVLLSTGASKISEIYRAVELFEEEGVKNITIMHCTLSYPTAYPDANLLVIEKFRQLFPGYRIGYSDHTEPDKRMLVLTTAYLYGAEVIEKHFTLDKTLPGNDHYHAMDPDDIRIFRENIEMVNNIKGSGNKELLASEKEARKHARRSIYSRKNIEKGELLSEDNLVLKRPGTGLTPEYLNLVTGNTAAEDIAEDVEIRLGMVRFK